MGSGSKFGSKIFKLKNILIIVTAMCVLSLSVVLAIGYGTKYYFSSFSQQKWINNPGKRYLMADSLLKSGKLNGLTKEEVYSLLGNKNSVEISEKLINFSLGGDFFLEVLVVEFDDAGKVIKTTTYTD